MTDNTKRLQTVISQAGICSRRKAAEMIEEGKVTVDGKVVTEKGYRVDISRQEVLVEGNPLPKQDERKYYFLLHKPGDVISTAHDPQKRRTVTEYFKDIDARLYPIGRLDKDTTGLLIITNDGDLSHNLSHPKFAVEKVYLVKVAGEVTDESLEKLKQGVDLDGKKTAPCEIEAVSAGKRDSVLALTLHEGKKRQIKRIFGTFGHRVLELKRIGYAGLRLGDLKEGEFRELSGEEVATLKDCVQAKG
jgi:23S rRNA pseudouridine2605 synthase